jgi:hypothetical protein
MLDPNARPRRGDFRALAPENIQMDQYLPVFCHAPKRGHFGLVQPGLICGSGRWVAQEMLVHGIDRLKREVRSLDVQFPAGIRLVCADCGAIQSKEDVQHAIDG